MLVGSGGLGEEVSPLLRLLTLPGSEYLLPLACNSTVNAIGEKLGSWIGRLGIRPDPAVAEILRSFESLGDAETRGAFIHTLRSVVDVRGQRVSANDKLYLASDVPTLIVWGDHDPIIPLAHALEAHEAHPRQSPRDLRGCRPLPALHRPGAVRRRARRLRRVDLRSPTCRTTAGATRLTAG